MEEMKEIIIDGVDVAGCEFFDYECNIYVNEYCEPQDNTKDMCKWHENCYYKQLKRLEQENINLKDSNNSLQAIIDDGREENKRWKQENERLKKEIRLYNCIDKWGTKECHCACRCLGNEFCIDADKKIDKYKSCLQEIKALANKFINELGDKYKYEKGIFRIFIEKISEVME